MRVKMLQRARLERSACLCCADKHPYVQHNDAQGRPEMGKRS